MRHIGTKFLWHATETVICANPKCRKEFTTNRYEKYHSLGCKLEHQADVRRERAAQRKAAKLAKEATL